MSDASTRFIHSSLKLVTLDQNNHVKYVDASLCKVGTRCITTTGALLTVSSNTSVLHSFITIVPKKGTPFQVSTHSDIAMHSCGYRQLRCGETFTLDAQSHDLTVHHILHRLKLYHSPIPLPQNDLPISPYIYGYWICKAKGSSIRFLDTHIIDEFKTYCNEMNFSFTLQRDTPCETTSSNHQEEDDGFKSIGNKRKQPAYRQQIWYYGIDGKFLELIKHHKLINNFEHMACHIDDMYMNGSIEQRIECLSGILDACGHIQHHGATYDITSRVEPFVYQIKQLALSVGLMSSIHYTDIVNAGRYTKKRITTTDGSFSKVPRLYISGDIDMLNAETHQNKCHQRKVTMLQVSK
jgi:hypothetical protein